MVSCHSAKFDGHRHFGSGDKMVFVCYVNLQDHWFKTLFDFIARSLSR